MVIGKTLFLASLAVSMVSVLIWTKTDPHWLNSSTATTQKADNDGFVKRLIEERVVAVHRWHVDDNGERELLCVFKAFDKDPQYEGSGVKLTVFDPSGVSLYENRFGEVQRVYQTAALRNLSSEMVVEVGYGGSTSFLRMLGYRAGKIVDLIDEKDSEFDIGAEVRPQFRGGLTPGLEPFQILLTRGVGLASPGRKYTTIYRYKDGKYRPVGEFAQQAVDNYIEDRLMDAGKQRTAK